MTKRYIFGVDFDGTMVQHAYPEIGEDIPHAVETLLLLCESHEVILWTMRSGDRLRDAVLWCSERGIRLYGVNEHPGQTSWTGSPKAYANMYIDDAALGCPLVTDPGEPRPRVDWLKVQELLRERGLIA